MMPIASEIEKKRTIFIFILCVDRNGALCVLILNIYGMLYCEILSFAYARVIYSIV